MKLSEISKSIADTGEQKSFFGVEVDEFITSVPAFVQEIGLLARQGDTEGALSVETIDALLAFASVGVKVILEVPFGEPLEPRDLVVMGANTDSEISILPPLKNAPDADWDRYTEILLEYTRAWLNQPNATKGVIPSVGYLQVLINEALGYIPEHLADSDYVQDRFVDGIPAEKMALIKDELRKLFFEHFGGEESFERFAHTVAASAYERLQGYAEQFKEHVAKQEESESNPRGSSSDS